MNAFEPGLERPSRRAWERVKSTRAAAVDRAADQRFAPVKQAVKRALIASLGRPIRCELCGEVLFRAVPVIRAGRVKLIGAEYALVRVEFASMNHLSFRHVEHDRCPALQTHR